MTVYSERSGHGHKSLNAAVVKALSRYNEIEVFEKNGFVWMGKLGLKLEGFYSAIIKIHPSLWAPLYAFAQHSVGLTNSSTKRSIKKRFTEEINSLNPDLILTVHGMFNEPIKQILSDMGRDIPLCSMLADIDEFGKVWYSPKCELYFYPSNETLAMLNKYGIRQEQKTVKISGVPVRKEFTDLCEQMGEVRAFDKDNLRVLLYYPKINLKPLLALIDKIISQTNLSIIVLTGEKPDKKTPIINKIQKYTEINNLCTRINCFGYTDNMHDVINSCDIVVGKGGPNFIFEAATLGVPAVIFETLPGQEVRNGEFVERNMLGLNCSGILAVFEQITRLLADDLCLLKKISSCQLEFTKEHASYQVADYIYNNFRSVDD